MLGVAYSKHGTLRYRVKGGYVTANSKLVAALYYQKNPGKVRVISRGGLYEYQHLTFKQNQRVKHVKQGHVLKIKAIKVHGQRTRLVLANGHVITANKQVLIKK